MRIVYGLTRPGRRTNLLAMSQAMSPEARRLVRIAFFVSGTIFALLLYLLYVQPPAISAPAWTGSLPAVNAGWNALTLSLVCLGVLAIRRGRRRLHAGLQIAALTSGALFLAGYVVYHHFHGDTPYPGTGVLRPIYFFILITHILASAAALPLLLSTVLFAATRRFSLHRRWARVTVPVWLYASLTGLLVFVFLTAAA